MKKNIIIIIIGVVAIFVTSCEDFLDKNPLDQVTSETFWNTEKDAEMGLAGVYSRVIDNPAIAWRRADWDALSDNAYQRHNHMSILNIAQGNVEATSGGLIYDIYAQSYKGISSCNLFLANIDGIEMDEAKKNQYKGEVSFLRALFYFTLSEFYGGVPLYTEPVTIEESMVEQSSKADILAQVVKDLDVAINSLSNDPYSGHAVKGSALALKAKVMMHNEKWQEAADLANQVIESGVFSLYSDYPNLFRAEGQANNPEIMFSAQYLNPDRSAVSWGPDIVYGWWCSLNPTQDFVDAFECTDGLPIDQSQLYDPDNYKANRDPRLDYTLKTMDEPVIRSDGYEWSDYEGTETGYIVKKYIEPENVPIDYSVRDEKDFILLRYAEVLLIYAESKNEISGPDQSVYDAVNQVRARVNMPPLPAGLDKSAMRERIRHERRVEFGLEGLRYLDLKRWKTAETVIPTIVDPGGVQRQFNAHHYLWPFAQSEMDVNPKLKQNPGY